MKTCSSCNIIDTLLNVSIVTIGRKENKHLCMIGILQYLVVELEEEEMTKKFKHYPYDLILQDIYRMDKIREANKYVNRYVTELIEMLENI